MVRFTSFVVVCSLYWVVGAGGLARAANLSLEDVIERASVEALAVKRAEVEVMMAQIRADSNYSVYLPHLASHASYTRLSQEDQPDLFPGVTFPQFLDQTNLQGTLSFLVSDYFLTRPALYRSADIRARLKRYEKQSVRETMGLVAAQTALAFIATQKAQAVTHKGAVTLRSRQHDMQRLEKAGAVTTADTLAIRAQAAALEGESIRVEGQLRILRLRLLHLLRLPAKEKLELKIPLDAPPPLFFEPGTDLSTLAFASRPDLKTLEEVIKLQDTVIEGHFGALWPEVVLAGSLIASNPNNRIFPPVDKMQATWNVTAQVAWSPNEFIAERTLWKEAKMRGEALLIDLRSLRDTVEVDIASAQADSETAKKLYGAAYESHSAAAAARDDQAKLFEAGEGTAQQLLDREQAFRQAALSKIDASVQLHLASIRLRKATGFLTQPLSHTLKSSPKESP
jgi:outer membrane protein TolC